MPRILSRGELYRAGEFSPNTLCSPVKRRRHSSGFQAVMGSGGFQAVMGSSGFQVVI